MKEQSNERQDGCIITFEDNDVTLDLVHNTLVQSSLFALGEKIEVERHPTLRQAIVVKCRPELQPLLQALADNVVREYVRWMVQQHRNFMAYYKLFHGTRRTPGLAFVPENLKLSA